MAIAIKDFRYWDRQRQESVQIRAGDRVDPTELSHHGIDLLKLSRVKFLDLETGEGEERPREVVRKRGRPKKQIE